MAQYTAIFTKPYEDGYENLPSQNTPITAETLNDKDDAIVNIETYLSGNDIPSDAEGLSYDNTDSGLTADNVQSAIDELADEKVDKTWVDVKTDTTGQFNTITGGLMQSCVVTLEPVQSGSGDPSPSNVRPITGHTAVEVGNVGKNLCNNSTNTVGYYDGYGSYVSSNDHRTSALIEVEPNTTYIGSLFDTSNNSLVSNLVYTEWDENQNFIRQITNETITTGNTTKYLRVRNYNAQSTIVKTDYYAYQLEVGSTATDFEPYNGTDYTISLGQTVYGGSLDAVSGVLTVDRGYTTVGSLNWTESSSSYGRFQSTDLSNVMFKSNTEYVALSDSYVSKSNDDCVAYVNQIYGNFNGRLSINDTAYSSETAEAFKTARSAVQICYKLATPLTIQLTPQQIETLIGENHLDIPLVGQSLDSLTYREMMAWDDVTDIVEPIADDVEDANEKGYIGFNLFERLEQGAISGTDGSLVSATTRCRSNDFVEIKSASYNITQLATVKTLIIQYDASKQFIVTDYSMWNNNITTYNFTPNSSAKYIKIATGFRTDAICTPSDFVSNTALSVKSNTQLDATKADIAAIGTDESGRATASKAYTVGEHFIKDGKFCTAIASISSGATLTLNTNYVEGTIADNIRTETKTASVTSGITWLTITDQTVIRQGRVVSFSLVVTISNMPTLSGSTNIIDLPFVMEGKAKFVQMNNSSDFEVNTHGLYIASDTKNIKTRGQIADGGYYISGTYICKRQ